MKITTKIAFFSTIILLQGCGSGSSSPVVNQPDPQTKRDVYVLGSSLLEYMNNALITEANKNNYNLYNYAKAGEYLYSMCLRVGAFPGTVKFKNSQLITNTKNYFNADWPVDGAFKTFDAEINKIKGQIGVDQNGYYFTFSNANNINIDTSVSYPILSLFPKVKSNSIFIVNLGKNNLIGNDPVLGTSEYVINKSTECVNWIDQNLTHNIINTGFFTSTTPTPILINKVNSVNSYLSQKYKNHYIDLKSYIDGNQIWLDTQITPNTLDLDSQIKQAIPLSLAKDQFHINEKVNIAISQQIFKEVQKF